MVISFILKKALPKKKYLYMLTMTTILLAISYFSVGVPRYSYDAYTASGGVLFYDSVPLSFPFQSSLSRTGIIHITQYYRLQFLMITLHASTVVSANPSGNYFSLTWIDYALFFSFFLLVNIAGAAIGYWIGKRSLSRTFLGRKEN